MLVLRRRGNTAAAMRVASHAVAMGDAPGFNRESVAKLNIASTIALAESNVSALYEAHVRHQANTVFFIREVRPDNIIEDMAFDSINGEWESGHLFRAGGVLE